MIVSCKIVSDGYGNKILLPPSPIPCHAVEMRDGRGTLGEWRAENRRYLVANGVPLD